MSVSQKKPEHKSKIQVPNQAPYELLLQLYRAALDAANPGEVIPPHLPMRPKGRTVVVGIGKAAAAMAQAVEDHWHGPLTGVVVVPEGATRPLRNIAVLIGSHPVPDENSVAGADALLNAVSGLQEDDLVIALISGGGSALCAKPPEGLTLADKQNITRSLLRNGASISEINTVRRHLSAIKGGRLAAKAYPAQVVTLLISDIPGDDPALIASGPTLADATTCADSLAILQRYEVTISAEIVEALSEGRWESVKPGDERLGRNRHVVVASAWDGMKAASQCATKLGLNSYILSDSMEGEARDLAKALAAIALSVSQRGVPFNAPCVLLSGGEATVTVRGNGRGGRNTEFVLAMALSLQGQRGEEQIHTLSAGTDGLDGRSGAAGAWCDSTTLGRIESAGLSAVAALDTNDSGPVLQAANALIHTGPTFTNINDFRAILVL